MVWANMPEMSMEMNSAKCMSIPWRASGLCYVPADGSIGGSLQNKLTLIVGLL
jgi:hypothetical protein